MTGRTTWWAKDAAWLRRELIVELGEEFGAAGPLVMDALSSWAQEQRAGGTVRGGFRTLARETFVTPCSAESIVSRAAAIGALDDLELDADGRRFVCRVSGWKADSVRGRAAIRMAEMRADAGETPDPDDEDSPEQDLTDRDLLRPVTPSALPDQTIEEENNNVSPARLDEARQRIQGEQIQQVFDEWINATGKTSRTILDEKRRRRIRNALKTYPLDEVLAAVRGWRNSPHHRGENSTGTVYNDLDLLLRDNANIERFRDLDTNPPGRSTEEAPADRAARFNARYGDSAA